MKEFFKISTVPRIHQGVGRMDTYKTILTKLDVRQFDAKKVPADVKLKVLEAARASGTGINKQHWRSMLAQDKVVIKKLAEDSKFGRSATVAEFSFIVVAD